MTERFEKQRCSSGTVLDHFVLWMFLVHFCDSMSPSCGTSRTWCALNRLIHSKWCTLLLYLYSEIISNQLVLWVLTPPPPPWLAPACSYQQTGSKHAMNPPDHWNMCMFRIIKVVGGRPAQPEASSCLTCNLRAISCYMGCFWGQHSHWGLPSCTVSVIIHSYLRRYLYKYLRCYLKESL